MDNLAPHQAAGVRAALGRAGLEHRHLPAYSPDMNPVEPC
jgi:transposase